jgi:aminoglycoside phosphotransferase (APT) family kinase protein
VDRRLGNVVARGSRSTVYAWGRGAVAKVPDPSTPDGWIHFEALYTAAVREAGAPAPRLLGIEQVDGRAVSVFERIDGPSMWQEVCDRPDRCAGYGRLLADLQVSLFALVPPVSLPTQRDRLMCKIRRAADSVDRSLATASSILPRPDGSPRLCHGDLHPGNVILSPNGPVIIDWFDVSRGDPIADIARTSLLLLPEAESCPAHLPGPHTGPLAALAEAYLARVIRRLGVPGDRLERWRAVEAAARLAEGVSEEALLAIWQRAARLAAVVEERTLQAVAN